MSSQDNVNIARKAYADFQRGDIAAILAVLDDSIEWSTPGDASLPTAGTRRGKAAVAEFFKVVGETWDFDKFEPRDYLADGDRVVALGHYDARCRTTGRRASADWAMAWEFRNGKVTHFQEYTDTQVLSNATMQHARA
ncbi:MAG TPA: nuclear transport factor 2 family protein [Bryobacteraceae bacterium]|jgi:hypothetical protein